MDVAAAVSNPNLELKLYGPTAKEILMTGAADGKVRQWHTESGQEFGSALEVHAGAVHPVLAPGVDAPAERPRAVV